MEKKQTPIKRTKESFLLEYEFYECEHEGDLDNYISDIQKSGGVVINSEINHEAEICTCTVRVKDLDLFQSRFVFTPTYNFIN